MTIKTLFLYLLFATQLTVYSHAQELDTPTGPVILTITGEICLENSTGTDSKGIKTVQFDLAMLENLGLITITTETPWTDGMVEFQGVLIRDLLASVVAKGKSVRASALNSYAVDIPVSDFLIHDVILATRKNGSVLRVRDNGPLWVIYPWSEYSELKRPQYFARSVWQLNSLNINK